MQQSDTKTFVTAPCRFACSSPYFYLPCTCGVALQLFACITKPELLVTLHLTSIPYLALVVADNNLVGRLLYVLLITGYLP